MDCRKCCQNGVEAFKEAACMFNSRRDLTFFLLNVVLNLKEKDNIYCFCETSTECSVCQIKKLFAGDKYDIEIC